MLRAAFMAKPEWITNQTPAELGYSMPAEWEPHEATWLGWPHNASDWPDKLDTIRWVYGEMVRKISPGEWVRILVRHEAERKLASDYLKRAGCDLKRLQFVTQPTDRGWTRDSGPIFVRRQLPSPLTPLPSDGRGEKQRARVGKSRSVRNADRLTRILPLPGGEGWGEGEHAHTETAIVHFHFNAWAKYPDWRKDTRVPETAARLLDKPIFDARINNRPFILEGGGIEVNGRGTLLTTEECYLHPKIQVRNPGLIRAQYEEQFQKYLGVRNVLWLGNGPVGDDTHGHIDDIARFVNPRTLVLIRESNPRDVNYRALEENWERVSGLRLEDGTKPEVVPLPMPAPIHYGRWRLPASYANFYIANACVIVPTFNDANDRVALGTLGELFTDRPVVGIHAVDLVLGFGALHCLTQQQPA